MTSTPDNRSDYPAWICAGCGAEYGHVRPMNATFHEPGKGERCGWCGRKDTPLTEPRDYGYPALYR